MAGPRGPGATEPPQVLLPHCAVALDADPAAEYARHRRISAGQDEVVHSAVYGRSEMSTLMKNKSLLLLPIGLAILIVIGILTS
jgi:hypothetical protein